MNKWRTLIKSDYIQVFNKTEMSNNIHKETYKTREANGKVNH